MYHLAVPPFNLGSKANGNCKIQQKNKKILWSSSQILLLFARGYEKFFSKGKIHDNQQNKMLHVDWTEETIFGLKVRDHIPDFELTYGVIRSKQPGDDCCDKNKIYLLLKQHCQKSYTRQILLNMILNVCSRNSRNPTEENPGLGNPLDVSSPVSKQMPSSCGLWIKDWLFALQISESKSQASIFSAYYKPQHPS